jgi:glucosamine 6-phosphate synthetase-like amidotransferase/phosphosugar isomerase protein
LAVEWEGMADEVEVKPGCTPEDVAALIATLRSMVELEDGELYTLRKGQLHHVVRRDEENGLRRIMVMEEAYDAAQIMARRLRRRMRGYRPDPALVVSACVMYAVEHLAPEEAEAIALAYLQRLFSRIGPPGDAEAQAAPDAPMAA